MDSFHISETVFVSVVLLCVQPDVFSFNTAIAACARAGDWRKALDLLAGMKVEGLTPDIFSYNAAIGACAKGGQWMIGLELLDKVQRVSQHISIFKV